MNPTLRIFFAFDYYSRQRRREKRREARRRKRRCPPPPSPASPPPPPPTSPPPPPPAPSRLPSGLAPAPASSAPPQSQTRSPTHPNKVKRKSACAFNSSDSDYSPIAVSNKSDSDFATPPKKTKLFSNDDEIKILKGLLYMNENNEKKTGVTDEVAEYINKSLRRRNVDFTKIQLRRKIRGMKDKYTKNRDSEGKFYKLCAKIWGNTKEEEPMNSSSVLFENDLNAHNSRAADTNEEGNDLIARRRAENKRKLKELDIMTLQLYLKRLAVMKEIIEAVLGVIQ